MPKTTTATSSNILKNQSGQEEFLTCISSIKYTPKNQVAESNNPVRIVLIIESGFPNTIANISAIAAIINGIQIDNFLLLNIISSSFLIKTP